MSIVGWVWLGGCDCVGVFYVGLCFYVAAISFRALLRLLLEQELNVTMATAGEPPPPKQPDQLQRIAQNVVFNMATKEVRSRDNRHDHVLRT